MRSHTVAATMPKMGMLMLPLESLELGDQITNVSQNDELMNRSLLTIPVQRSNMDREGVFWSLPLSRMQYYSRLVVAKRHLASDTSKISIRELHVIVLGTSMARWGSACSSDERGCKLIISLAKLVDMPISWLALLTDAAQTFLDSSGLDKENVSQLLRMGKRRRFSFLNDGKQPPFFGLASFSKLLPMFPILEVRIVLFRRAAQDLGAGPDDLIIRCPRYTGGKQVITHREYKFASAIPGLRDSMKRTIDDALLAKEGHFRWLPREVRYDDANSPGSCAAVLDAGETHESRQLCKCIEPNSGYQCIREAVGLQCSFFCHSFPVDCSNKGTGSKVGQWSLEDQMQSDEGGGEECFFIPLRDIRSEDDIRIFLRRPQEQQVICTTLCWMIRSLLSSTRDVEGTIQVQNQYRSMSRDEATLDGIEHALSTLAPSGSELQYHLQAWWRTSTLTQWIQSWRHLSTRWISLTPYTNRCQEQRSTLEL